MSLAETLLPERVSELDCLIHCCKVGPGAADVAKIRDFIGGSDEKALADFVDLAQGHAVYPLVYHAIRDHTADLLSTQRLDELKRANMQVVMQNMHMTAELIHILACLGDKGIQARAFKGPELAQFAYGDIALRQYCDLDILVKRQDVARALEVFESEQYVPEIKLPAGSRKAFFNCVNVIGLTKKIRIELHWELLSRNYAIDWPEAALWAGDESTRIDEVEIPILPYNTRLLYLCAHGSKHLFVRLEWVCDIDRILRAIPDSHWPELFAEARALGIERMLRLGLYLSHILLDAKVEPALKCGSEPDLEVELLGRQIIALHFTSASRAGHSYSTFKLLWRMRENLSDRLRFAWRALFAPKFDDFKAVQLPGYLQFLYPVIRPFRLFLKYLR